MLNHSLSQTMLYIVSPTCWHYWHLRSWYQLSLDWHSDHWHWCLCQHFSNWDDNYHLDLRLRHSLGIRPTRHCHFWTDCQDFSPWFLRLQNMLSFRKYPGMAKIIIYDKSLMELRNFTIHKAQRDKDRTENWYFRQKLIHYKPPHYSRPCSWCWVSSHLVCVLMSRGRLAPAPEFEGKLFGFLVASRWSRSRCAGSEAEESDGLVTWTRVHHDTWWHV